MGKDASVTPKATLTVKDITNPKGATAAGLATFKLKKGDVNASLALTDQTVKNVKTLKDVVATVDYRAPRLRGVVLNSKYEFATKKYQVGATWDGQLLEKPSTIKLWYTNKDNLAAGEATVGVARGQKANVTFNQKKVLTAKYTLAKGDFTYEPSYNFVRSAPAVAVSKKQGKELFKLAYDLKSEVASLEWTHKPLKVTVASVVSKDLKVAKPSVSAVFENVYSF
ncbi:hypothetical protein TSOC_010664 [Tetrabaena socialis]|uniref:Uncharacterized protein n=1 Tax=Tetrabaena socialis TaxID=47790 RepID=A0A2J7ZSR6_9CHLO|nr:hypothetical protein TSOC_010664 [Tetrabaena socialis]|eukprot:PNH03298.1 hypothetical protein TSOC_010664 [Tetrabaena socialis]